MSSTSTRWTRSELDALLALPRGLAGEELAERLARAGYPRRSGKAVVETVWVLTSSAGSRHRRAEVLRGLLGASAPEVLAGVRRTPRVRVNAADRTHWTGAEVAALLRVVRRDPGLPAGRLAEAVRRAGFPLRSPGAVAAVRRSLTTRGGAAEKNAAHVAGLVGLLHSDLPLDPLGPAVEAVLALHPLGERAVPVPAPGAVEVSAEVLRALGDLATAPGFAGGEVRIGGVVLRLLPRVP
jgi:hypothetical protein